MLLKVIMHHHDMPISTQRPKGNAHPKVPSKILVNFVEMSSKHSFPVIYSLLFIISV